MRRGSAPLGQLLESFGWCQKFASPNCQACRRAGGYLSPEERCLVPPPWAKGLGAITSAFAAQGLCLCGVPELEQERFDCGGRLKDVFKAINNART